MNVRGIIATYRERNLIQISLYGEKKNVDNKLHVSHTFYFAPANK